MFIRSRKKIENGVNPVLIMILYDITVITDP